MKRSLISALRPTSPWRAVLKGAASIFDISGGASTVKLNYAPKLGTLHDDAKALGLDWNQVGRDIDKILSSSGLAPRRRGR